MANAPVNQYGNRTPSIDTGAPVPVAVDSVDSQLAALWRNVAELAQTKGGGMGVTMAQVVNLIVRSDSYAAANDYTRDIDSITGLHPARVVMMTTDPDDEEMPVQAWVSIHCQLPPSGGRQVCAEQVWVAAGNHSMRQVPAAVIPLLLPELPVFLWWPKGAPFDEYVFRQLGDSLNRLIVDSSTFENPEGTLAKMATRMNRDWPNIAFTDMNWGRLTRWRELTAQFFDGAALRPYLDRIGTVILEYGMPARESGINRSQALLYIGWLASRLGWQPADPVYEVLRSDGAKAAEVRVSLMSGTRRITALIRPSEEPSEVPGDLRAMVLEVPGSDPSGPPEARFSVRLAKEADMEDCAQISASLGEANTTDRLIQVEPMSRATLLDGDLEVFSHDRIYEEALDLASAIARGTTRQDHGPRKIISGEPLSAISHRPRPPEVLP